jgi:hypothetical protein
MKYSRLILLIVGLITVATVHAGWKDLLNSAKDYAGSSGLTSQGSGALSNDQVVDGLKEALSVGAEKAVAVLGQDGGFLNDPQVKIPLPKTLDTVAKGLRAVGKEQLADEFVATMNSAAEQAVPQTLSIFSAAIRDMTLTDARGILQGGDTAATDYFRTHSTEQLNSAILPIVKQATESAGVTSSYKKMTGNLGFLQGFSSADSLDLDNYVTDKAVEGLFTKLAAEEKLIRENPLARTTDLLKTVFGSVGK